MQVGTPCAAAMRHLRSYLNVGNMLSACTACCDRRCMAGKLGLEAIAMFKSGSICRLGLHCGILSEA